ncbi:hypothetical protein [Leptospira kirschneri]|uniref:hypothetical protein n=1 Tax=Leptospira kirschneri TaxID=29507 RepID=UPI003567F8F5
MPTKNYGSIRNITNHLTQEDRDLTEFDVSTNLSEQYVDVRLRLQLPNGSTQEDKNKLFKWIEIGNLFSSAR